MRGRKPTPSALRVLRGNPGRRPLPKDEPIAPKADPNSPPPRLKGIALEQWQQVAPMLHTAGLLTTLDPTALQLYCEAYAEWDDAKTQIEKFGTVIKGPRGFPVVSPYVSLAAKAWERMRKMLIEFGMTPSARTRVKTEEQPQADDPFAEFARADLERWKA
jgi:P27 family predicted phage terminase small subunit